MDSQVFHAAQNGDISKIRSLYNEEREILHQVTFKKSNVLHIAAREGHTDFVRWILDNVKDSSMCVARNSYLNTPLHEAAQAGDAELVSIFISRDHRDLLSIFISLFVRGRTYPANMFGETPLLIACRNGHEKAATMLLERSKSINLLSPKYQPYLHVAVCGGHLGVVRLLLSKYKIKRCCMPHGATPLHAAIYAGHIDIVGELLNADFREPDWNTCWRKWLQTEEDSHGNCGIHAAIVKGRIDIIDCLRSSTPDCIEIRNGHGNTPLHLAVQNAVDLKLVEYLVHLPGVNVNAVNNKGLTPLDIAVKASPENSTSEIIRILEEHGASANYKLQSNDDQVSGCVPKGKEKEETENKDMDVDTLVASLIATVTFAAIFQVPGGTDDNGLARRKFEPFFTLFLVSDTVALFTSLIVVIGWIFGERLQKRKAEMKSLYMFLSALCLGISIASTAFAFMSAAFLVIIPPDVKDLKEEDEETFHKYYQLYRLVVYLSTIPMTIAIIVQTCCLCLRRVGHTWREKAAAVTLLGMAAMFLFFCVYQAQVEKELWGDMTE